MKIEEFLSYERADLLWSHFLVTVAVEEEPRLQRCPKDGQRANRHGPSPYEQVAAQLVSVHQSGTGPAGQNSQALFSP